MKPDEMVVAARQGGPQGRRQNDAIDHATTSKHVTTFRDPAQGPTDSIAATARRGKIDQDHQGAVSRSVHRSHEHRGTFTRFLAEARRPVMLDDSESARERHDIIAQPPGKSLQASAASGGAKSPHRHGADVRIFRYGPVVLSDR